MNIRPSVLCPIDYSDPSAAALRCAAMIAAHFVTRLIVLAVEDPLGGAAKDDWTGSHWTRDAAESKVAAFVSATLGSDASMVAMCECDVAVGSPAMEILRVTRERSCALIVMSAQAWSEIGKPRVGSTTERVLRRTSVPVLVTCTRARRHSIPTQSSWAELLGVSGEASWPESSSS